jgi:hypothetical protein
MRNAFGLVFTVVLAACGGPPAPSPVVVQNDASVAPAATGPAGKPVPDAPSPEIAALRRCEARRADDPELKAALESTKKLAAQGPLADHALVDALWTCFDRFRPSQATSINVVRDLADAIMAVKDASYAAKAAAKIAVPIGDAKDPAESMDQIQFWQAISIRLLGELHHGAGVRALVTVLLDDAKKDLVYVVRTALAKMPKDAEPLLIATLAGTDAELAQIAGKSADQAWTGRVVDALAAISRDPGREAILDALPKTTNESTRAILALDLTRFPTTPRSTKAFLDTYAKLSPSATLAHYGGMNARALLAGATPGFFDPSFGDWVLKENAAAKGDAANAMSATALPAAIKLMTTANSKAVGTAVNKIAGQAIEKDMYKNAVVVLDACKKDVACYLKELAKPVPTDRSPSARMGHVKAAWMAGMYGDASTRAALVDRLNGLKEGAIRLAIIEAIDHLSPKGDAAAADKLDALVGAARASTAMSGLDEMANLALRLRARAL